MCGFSGIIFSNTQTRDRYQPGINGFRSAAQTISHRGNTDHAEYLEKNVWLHHYRLAFQDLLNGKQPMLSADEQHIIVFNGEIYNHLEIRKQLTHKFNIPFRTTSDTETILEGWKQVGNSLFNLLEGEYAFVILDTRGTSFVAHRDDFGVKPLFAFLPNINTRNFSVYRQNYTFEVPLIEFSSEIKGITSRKNWNRDGLLRQFVGLYEPICTPFENIIQILPGSILTAKNTGDKFQCCLESAHSAIRASTNSIELAADEDLENILKASVSERLLSDVELGVYLSGGIDSKVMAFELQRATNKTRNIKSFTVGFSDKNYDETDEVFRFSSSLGLTPHIITVDSNALNYSYPLAIQASELVQPYTNGAAKWWLSLFTRQYVQGVITGDGADEVFCGYPSYRYAYWWKHIMRARGLARNKPEVEKLLKRYPMGSKYRDDLYVKRFSQHARNPWLSGSSAEGTGEDFINSMRMLGVFHPLFGQIHAITNGILGENHADKWLQEQANSIQSWFTAGMNGMHENLCNPQYTLLLWQNYFSKTHLPVLILNWVGDRMEMANTLEGRTPFLSKRLKNFLYSQPDRALVQGLKDKALLRRTYSGLLKKQFAMTPKKQFNAPLINSDELANKFNTQKIFEMTGLADNQRYDNLCSLASSDTSSYSNTHIKSAIQTAISLSIVQHTLVNGNQLDRNKIIEQNYLAAKEKVEEPVTRTPVG